MVLYAGPFKMLYDRGFLRYVRYGNAEILRMIYYTVRDENWGTCDHRIFNEYKEISWETFRIEYDCIHYKGNKDLVQWHTVIDGKPDGSINFTIDGAVINDHLKNRSGFCVLHPITGIVGQDVEITH